MENIKSFEKLIEAKKIVIPQIQRDYVQGSDKHSEKREKFIDTLIEHLREKKNLHLDFIYGSCDEDNKSIFYPLDGQQRLTTLYLLHWILEVLARRRNGAVENGQYIDVLTYQSRRSSDLFCHKLSTDKYDDTFKGNPVSEYIKKEKMWYVSEWNLDPTIRAILEMLDVMQRKLSGYTKEQLDLMLNNFEAISFDCCDLDDYHLTDSLYIKMNERGKQLTEFENWKASFIGFLEKEDKKSPKRFRDPDKHEKFSDVFKDSIEHEWTDMLWPYALEKWQEELEKLSDEEKSQKSYPAIDDYFMNLLAFVHETLFFALNPKVEGRDVQTGDFHDTLTSMEKVFANEENLTFLFDFLDVWCKVEDINSFFNDLFGEKGLTLWGSKECDNLFKECIDNGLGMQDGLKILFYAISKYFISTKCDSVTNELKMFVRICRNLIESVYQFDRSDVACYTNIRLTEWSRYKRAIDGIVCNIVSNRPWFENVGAFGDIEHEKEKYGDNGQRTPFYERWEDKEIFKGCLKVVLPSLRDGNKFDDVDNAITAFINADEVEKIQLLVAFGYDGYYSTALGGSAGREMCFFGRDGKWDVIFRRSFEKEDEKNEVEKRVETAFSKFVSEYKECPNVEKLIMNKLQHSEWNSFKYYMLKYPEFVKGNKNTHYYAVQGEWDDLDIINIEYSPSPLRKYHCDPFTYVVSKRVDDKINQVRCWSRYGDRSSVYLNYASGNGCFMELHNVKDGWIIRNIDEKNKGHLLSLYAELERKGIEMGNCEDGEKLIRVEKDKGDLIELGERVAKICLDWINKTNFDDKLE